MTGSAPKIRQTLLVIDDGLIDSNLLQLGVVEKLHSEDIHLTLVFASDGAKGIAKFLNQKFDAVVVNSKVPRISESGLYTTLESPKSGFKGRLYLVGGSDEKIPRFKNSQKFPVPLEPQKLIEALLEDLGRQGHRSTSAAYAVDVRVINAILASTLKVLGQFGMADITMMKPQPRALNEPLPGVISSVLEIKSVNFMGRLSMSFDEPSFLEMVSGMLCEEQTAINAENQDAVGEINNIIFGNAKPDLANYGVQLTIPKVVIGVGQAMICPEHSAALRIPFQTPKGKFFIDLIAYPVQ